MNHVGTAPSRSPSASALGERPDPSVGDGVVTATLSGPQFSARVDGATRTVFLSGELDLAAVRTLGNACAFLALGAHGDTVLDLAGLEFIDASGLGAVIRARNEQVDRGDRLLLLGATPTVRRTFSVGGLSSLLDDGAG